MGYSTDFKGSLTFTRDLKGSELSLLSKIFQEDCRNHEDWPNPYEYELSYMDLKLTEGMDGIEWDGSEKTAPMYHLVNVLIEVMQRDVEDFGLTGKLIAQGEEIDDRWELQMIDNVATKVDVKPTGTAVICPHCEGKVYLSEAEEYPH